MTATSIRPSVILAEDDLVTRTQLSAMLGQFGYSTVAVPDGDRAWTAFQAAPPQIIVADWQMPGINGIELCRRIRDRAEVHCFVMIITARDGADDLQMALDAGADDYITKPITRQHFGARLLIAERHIAAATARRIAEAEVARLRWLAGVGQTVLAFQHEINNPLTALYGHLEAVAQASDLPAALLLDVSEAQVQAERIADIVRRLAAAEHHSIVEAIPGHPMLAVPPSSTTTVPVHGTASVST